MPKLMLLGLESGSCKGDLAGVLVSLETDSVDDVSDSKGRQETAETCLKADPLSRAAPANRQGLNLQT